MTALSGCTGVIRSSGGVSELAGWVCVQVRFRGVSELGRWVCVCVSE